VQTPLHGGGLHGGQRVGQLLHGEALGPAERVGRQEAAGRVVVRVQRPLGVWRTLPGPAQQLQEHRGGRGGQRGESQRGEGERRRGEGESQGSRGPHLLGEKVPGLEVQVSSQTSEQSHEERSALPHAAQVGQAVHHRTHQTGLHHKVILRRRGGRRRR